MSSDLSGLPPSFVARASAMAQIQDVAVKLVGLPEGLQNNSAPVKLQGTVAGQAPDGSLRLETKASNPAASNLWVAAETVIIRLG